MNAVSITIYYRRDCNCVMELFVGENAAEQAKTWFINELSNNIGWWCDVVIDEETGKEKYVDLNTKEDIKKALDKLTIPEIIEGLNQGGYEDVIYKCK